MRRGFTLIELLLCIGIIAMLSALLFPVFASAKKSAKRISTLQRARGIGMGVQLYGGDWDDRYPRAVTASNGLASGIGIPEDDPSLFGSYDEFRRTPTLRDLVGRYAGEGESWRSLADNGLARPTLNDYFGDPAPPISGSAFAAYGTSFTYRSLLGFAAHPQSAPCQIPGKGLEIPPSQTVVVSEMSPRWNDYPTENGPFYAVTVFGDGHVKLSDVMKDAAGWLCTP